jgi:hypothetical protein
LLVRGWALLGTLFNFNVFVFGRNFIKKLIIIIIKYKDEPEEDGVLLGVPTAEPSLSMSKLSPSISWELCL